MSRGFDLLSPVYDGLARIVFGNSIVESQTAFLYHIPHGSKILILGGGTGWLLEAIDRINPSCEIWYVEVSAGMINKAKQRNVRCVVHFVQGTESSIPSQKMFDVVITNFYLDLFSEEKLRDVIKHIGGHLHTTSVWLVTDFQNTGAWWQKYLLKAMYLFFRAICKMEGRSLPDWLEILRKAGWKESESQLWFNRFIRSSRLYRLPAS